MKTLISLLGFFTTLSVACTSTPNKSGANPTPSTARTPAADASMEGEWRGTAKVRWPTKDSVRDLNCVETVVKISRAEHVCTDATPMYALTMRCEDEYLSKKAQNIFHLSAHVCASNGRSRWQMLEVAKDEESQLRFSIEQEKKGFPEYLEGVKYVQNWRDYPSLIEFTLKREK